MTIQKKPHSAFILAAGKGTRLRPYTDDKPKPMVEVHGKPLVSHIIDKLGAQGVDNITINTSYLGDVLENYLNAQDTPPLFFSHEDELLETGGGVKKALHTMNDEPFYLINGDAYWVDEDLNNPALKQLQKIWNDAEMDMVLLLQPVSRMSLTGGVGDYHMNDAGQLERAKDLNGDYMFTGIRIVHPRVFKDTPDGAFSFLECMDKAQEQRRLYGVSYENGQWHHISTPKDLDAVNADKNTKQQAA